MMRAGRGNGAIDVRHVRVVDRLRCRLRELRDAVKPANGLVRVAGNDVGVERHAVKTNSRVAADGKARVAARAQLRVSVVVARVDLADGQALTAGGFSRFGGCPRR